MAVLLTRAPVYFAILMMVAVGGVKSSYSNDYINRPSAKYLVDAAFAKAYVDKCPKQLRVKRQLLTEHKEAYGAFLELFREKSEQKKQLLSLKRSVDRQSCSVWHEHFNLIRSGSGAYRYVESIN